jgi:hypothetical protein
MERYITGFLVVFGILQAVYQNGANYLELLRRNPIHEVAGSGCYFEVTNPNPSMHKLGLKLPCQLGLWTRSQAQHRRFHQLPEGFFVNVTMPPIRSQVSVCFLR